MDLSVAVSGALKSPPVEVHVCLDPMREEEKKRGVWK
jgi:hypothetical protein